MSAKEIDRVTVISQCIEKKITQKGASKILGITLRQVKRLVRRYREDGPQGLISRSRGKSSNHSLSNDIKKQAIHLIEKDFYDYGPTLAAEKLSEYHHIKVSKETARTWMIEAGIWQAYTKKAPRIHPSRERRAHLGELVQIDGSDHDWFEGRAPRCTLLVFIDDATSEIKKLYFCDQETTINYFIALKDYVLTHGVPRAFYFDKHNVFKVNHPESKSGTGLTQFGRALKELHIEPIFAHSPQAKGRVERSNGILQDRLVKALRYHNISNIAEANHYLESFIKEYNAKFAKSPRAETDVHRALTEQELLDLDKILSIQTKRVISKDLLVRHNNTIFKINEPGKVLRLRQAPVVVCENVKNTITIYHQNKPLNFEVYRKKPHHDLLLNRKDLNNYLDQIFKPQKTMVRR